jgi:hypothetical protein
MKKISLLCLLLCASLSNSWGATCTNAQGWRIATKKIHQPSRVPGNTKVFVSNPEGNVVMSFSATSQFEGSQPDYYDRDDYKLEGVWQDELGFESMSWIGKRPCYKCDYPYEGKPSKIWIKTKSSPTSITCEY